MHAGWTVGVAATVAGSVHIPPPDCGLANARARDGVRQLRTSYGIAPRTPRKVRMRHELPGRSASSRCDQPNPLRVMLPDETHRLGDVAVVGDDHRTVVGVQPGVVEQMHGEIDIGPFLLGLGDLRRSLFPHRVNERHSNLVAQKVPKVHLDLGPVGSQGAEVEILALRLRPVGRRGRHSRREILDRQDLVMGLKDPREQCRQVQPFPGRALERSIVEVEAVDVDDGAHASPSEKARASEEALRPAVETTRGVLNNIAAAGSEFNKPRPRPARGPSHQIPRPAPTPCRAVSAGASMAHPPTGLGEGHPLRGATVGLGEGHPLRGATVAVRGWWVSRPSPGSPCGWSPDCCIRT